MLCTTAASAKHRWTNETGLLPVQCCSPSTYLCCCASAPRLTLALPMKSTWGLTKKLSCCYQDFWGNFIFPTPQTLGTNWSLENSPPTPDMQILVQLPHCASVSPPQEMVFPSLIESSGQGKSPLLPGETESSPLPCSQAFSSFCPPWAQASTLVT